MQHSYIRSMRKKRRLWKTSAPAHFLQLDRWRCTLLEASIIGCSQACFFKKKGSANFDDPVDKAGRQGQLQGHFDDPVAFWKGTTQVFPVEA